ncbi:MFS transporter [Leeia oryzae]|uniref:MFS transporter n=1 Tax=Leeia oryzae TaxID=356662 RepID=UPI0003816E6C|nr:MFS transporter [Leeia oryzae]
MLATLRSLPRTVWLIGLISLVNDSASEMLYPLIPLYLSSVLMAGPKALGLIEGVAEATASLLKLFSGVLVDRTRKSKPWMVVGYLLAGVGRPLIAFISSWPMLLLIRFTDRVGKGLRSSPRDALLANSVDPSKRGLVFGVHRAMDNAGAIVGPLMAALLLSQNVPLKDLFLWSAIPAVICLCLTAFIQEAPAEAPNREAFDWQLGDMPPMFKRYLAVVALFTMGNASSMFLLLKARATGVPQAEIPLLWAMVSLVASAFSAPLAAFSDKIGRIRVLTMGYLAFGCSFVGLGLLEKSGWLLLVLFASYGLFMAATEGVEKALVADLAPSHKRGTAFGWFNLVTGAFLLPSSLVFGWLYQSLSPIYAFGFAGGCSLTAAALLWFTFPHALHDGVPARTASRDRD